MDWLSLTEKLKILGMDLGKNISEYKKLKNNNPIEDVIAGQIKETPVGSIFTVSEIFDLNHKHGKYNIYPQKPISILDQFFPLSDEKKHKVENLIFIDTETTGLSGGTGTFPFMVGVGRFIETGFLLTQFFLRHPGEEIALLHAMSELLFDMNAVVTYNGKSFDIPILNNRFVINQLVSPFKKVCHLDLLFLTRKIWRDQLDSCRLGNIEQQILEIIRTEEEIPGYLAPIFYKDYLKTGATSNLKGVFYHNAIDVISLASLLSCLINLLSDPIKTAESNMELAAIGKIYNEYGYNRVASELFELSLEEKLPQHIYEKTLLQQASLYKKQKKYFEAISFWEKAAYAGSIRSCEELAKYFEHNEKDLEQAYYWTAYGLNIITTKNQNPNHFIYRLNRLQRKIANQKI